MAVLSENEIFQLNFKIGFEGKEKWINRMKKKRTNRCSKKFQV